MAAARPRSGLLQDLEGDVVVFGGGLSISPSANAERARSCCAATEIASTGAYRTVFGDTCPDVAPVSNYGAYTTVDAVQEDSKSLSQDDLGS